MLNVTLLPILSDNYTYIIESGGNVGVIDPGEAEPIISFFKKKNIKPSIIFNTHHHYDHTDGNVALKEKYGCKIIGPEKDKHRIKEMDQGIGEKDTLQFGNEKIEIIDTVGHTSGHICFYFPDSHILFSGDTVFAMGCGRLFEGNAEDMYQSFSKIKKLPDNTKIYCGHEYTMSNAQFCLSIEPENEELMKRMADVQKMREEKIPTIPTTLGLEKETNVFMRAKTVQEFKQYRDLKDKF